MTVSHPGPYVRARLDHQKRKNHCFLQMIESLRNLYEFYAILSPDCMSGVAYQLTLADLWLILQFLRRDDN